MTQRLLEIKDLQVDFATRDGDVHAVAGLDLSLDRGETVALVGESGSGKSVTAQAILGLLETPPAHVRGSVAFDGQELLGMSEKQYRQIRGPRIAMIFQDALAALNPVLTVGSQIAEMFGVHQGLSRRQSRDAAIDVMSRVQISEAKARFGDYPHQFSGGMRQRVMIAMMIALRPEVLIADEPTTALDVTVQAQVLDLLAEIQEENGTALLLITHDIGVVAEVADRVAVMYAGRVMEQGSVGALFSRTANPYTASLLQSVPRIDRRQGRMSVIPGRPPSLLELPEGCAFRPRCPLATDDCRSDPPLVALSDDQVSRCWHAQEVVEHGLP